MTAIKWYHLQAVGAMRHPAAVNCLLSGETGTVCGRHGTAVHRRCTTARPVRTVCRTSAQLSKRLRALQCSVRYVPVFVL
eukprot:2998627-Rhodomonas_salina.1